MRSTAVILAGIIVLAHTPASFASGPERTLRLPWKGHAQSASIVVTAGDPLHPARCGVRPAAIVSGAGLTNLLGQMTVQQSHCLSDDGTFDQGEFEFTTPAGRTVRGRYFGQLIPTLPPVPNVAPSSGSIFGQVCVEEGSAYPAIVDDCAANRYSPALGLLDLATGNGTIFIDYALGVGR